MDLSGIYCVLKPTREELPPEVEMYLAENISLDRFFSCGHNIRHGADPKDLSLPDGVLQDSPAPLGSEPLKHIGAKLNPWIVQLIQFINPQDETFRDYQVVKSSPTQFVHLFNAATTVRCYDTAPEVDGNVVHPRGDMIWEERSEDWLEKGPRNLDDVPSELFTMGHMFMKLGTKQAHGVRETDGGDGAGMWGIGDERVYKADLEGNYYIAHHTDTRPFEESGTHCAIIEAETDYNTGDPTAAMEQRMFIDGVLSGSGQELVTFHSEHAEDPKGESKIKNKWSRLNSGILKQVADEYTPAPRLSPEDAAANKHFAK